MQSTMEPSEAKRSCKHVQTLSKRWWKRRKEGETNLSIDATEAFGNSFRISFAASASSLRFVFLFTLFLFLLLLFLCSLAFRFLFSFVFFFFIFSADLVRRCDCRRGRSSAKWMAPTTFNVFDGFISQMPTDTGRIDSYPNRSSSTSSNKLNSCDSMRLNKYSHTRISSPPTH